MSSLKVSCSPFLNVLSFNLEKVGSPEGGGTLLTPLLASIPRSQSANMSIKGYKAGPLTKSKAPAILLLLRLGMR